MKIRVKSKEQLLELFKTYSKIGERHHKSNRRYCFIPDMFSMCGKVFDANMSITDGDDGFTKGEKLYTVNTREFLDIEEMYFYEDWIYPAVPTIIEIDEEKT
ncbi:MAG TPA: hypothetical protein PK151_06285 [Caldisericia bacterium]|nr:hypothetical protein [Caldisericia bacterium]